MPLRIFDMTLRQPSTVDIHTINAQIVDTQAKIISSPAGNLLAFRLHHDLAVSYHKRFVLLGDMVDLEAALKLETAVVNFTTATQDPNLTALQHNLAVLHYKRYLSLGDPDDLEVAIQNGEASVSSTATNHPALGNRQDTTAVYQFNRFKLVGCRADLDAAVIYGEASLASTALEEIGTLARRRDNLAQYYHASYTLSNSLADLEVVLKYQNLIIEALPSGDLSLSECHRNLALLYAEYFRRSGDLNNFDCALKHTKFNSATRLHGGGFLFWPQGDPLPWTVSPHLITTGIANTCAGLVSLLSDNIRYRALLEHKGLVAQKALDLMQMVHCCPILLLFSWIFS